MLIAKISNIKSKNTFFKAYYIYIFIVEMDQNS